ncbi:GNAT family N-acetyltransferase [Streptomyces eurythermus]|uniref:GNAT family N-acetyltransferase n=1 Tax=Streptomyces eurythermus TaxID=42237 RepID=UPI0036FB05C6
MGQSRGPGPRGRRLPDPGLARWAVERGAKSLRLSAMPDNKRAAALYERHGFTDTGEAGDLLPDGRGREQVMIKNLTNS